MRYPLFPLLVQFAVVCLCANPVCSADVTERPATGASNLRKGVGTGYAVDLDSLKVMTFNIRWQGHHDGKFYDSGFARRRPLVLDVLTSYGADIIGLQEASIEQRATLAPELSGFGMFPTPAEAGDECILYRLDRFDLRGGGPEDLRREPERPARISGFGLLYGCISRTVSPASDSTCSTSTPIIGPPNVAASWTVC